MNKETKEDLKSVEKRIKTLIHNIINKYGEEGIGIIKYVALMLKSTKKEFLQHIF